MARQWQKLSPAEFHQMQEYISCKPLFSLSVCLLSVCLSVSWGKSIHIQIISFCVCVCERERVYVSVSKPACSVFYFCKILCLTVNAAYEHEKCVFWSKQSLHV